MTWALGVMLALLESLLLSSCDDDRFLDYHYKVTVYVDTPQGEEAFSSVREVRTTEVMTPLTTLGRTDKKQVSGEAMILDIPRRVIPRIIV